MTSSLLDLVLAVAVVWLAWMALASRDLFRSVILFIVFGLLMSITWVRLQAPDIALAEAAIGAGLTGALLLDAVAQFGDDTVAPKRQRQRLSVLTAVAVLGLGGVLVFTVTRLPLEPGGLTQWVAESLEQSGVSHPVTAVLLNFRGFDTWLEVGVLLLAVLAMLVVRRTHDLQDVVVPATGDPVLAGLPRLLLPIMVLASGYLLWLGTHAPGGAFQSGAVLASAGVLLFLAGHPSVTALRGPYFRVALLTGFVAFLLAAVGVMLTGRRLLEFPPVWAGTLIVVVEVAVTLSIGATLAALFAGARVQAHSGEQIAPSGDASRGHE